MSTALFHMNISVVGRRDGASAVAGAAYISRSKIYDERIGLTRDYRRCHRHERLVADLGPSGRLSDESRAKQDAVLGLPVTVAFADGTTFDATNANTHSQEQDDGTSAVTKTVTYDRTWPRVTS
ncbi:MAG TPA: hypothetical protein IAA19_01535 [Candidatus Olsenella pullistercoris]|uniref:MobA/MobL protein domain-containing protein n=1 Tax=Candidatus Olsenella pullistercoris TaxID=2838712 RepID=A0A9D2EYC8_9ACTN|nr:hypothetical protein [Candidatus Olsenella pullistercoris]